MDHTKEKSSRSATPLVRRRTSEQSSESFGEKTVADSVNSSKRSTKSASTTREKQAFFSGTVKTAGLRLLVVSGASLLIGAGLCFGALSLSGFEMPASAVGTSLVSSNGLDTVVARVRYGNLDRSFTMDELLHTAVANQIEETENGYSLPSSYAIVDYLYTVALAEEAKNQGIEVSDDEAYATFKMEYGTTDPQELAKELGISEEDVLEQGKLTAILNKLNQSTSDNSDISIEVLEAPSAEGIDSAEAATTPNETYGAYLVGLLGEYWDTSNETWDSTDNPFYEALKDQDFTSTSATFEQAIAAYNVALELSEDQTRLSDENEQAYNDLVATVRANTVVELYGVS